MLKIWCCETCNVGFCGQKEARRHKEETGHTRFHTIPDDHKDSDEVYTSI